MPEDSELAAELARLWPHREHESGPVRGLLCRAGLHCWRQLDLRAITRGRDIQFCFWCSKIKIDGVIHEP